MNFIKHLNLVGQHAFLGASTYHWLKYDENKLTSVYLNSLAKQRGTELHDFAAQCIRLKQKLPASKKALNLYVNDAIGYRMEPEQVLYYSDNCFGTADAISFKKDLLRIHDLKTGETQARFEQLFIYDALFCLEYRIDPRKIKFENRIYQYDDYVIAEPEANDIALIMDKIISSDKIIEKIKQQEA